MKKSGHVDIACMDVVADGAEIALLTPKNKLYNY
jgi:hypothetical protein